MYSPEAVELLVGTAAAESQGGYYWKQVNGPAVGIFQMEPDTEKDIWLNYISYHDRLYKKLVAYGYGIPSDSLQYDLKYQIIMCRLHYYRVSAPIPKTLEGQALYWKKYYNTYKGKGTAQKYMDKYAKYAL